MLETVNYSIILKHDNAIFRGKTNTHKIPAYPIKETNFKKNPHNYRRMYSISSYNNKIILSINNIYDVYMRDKITDEFKLYKGFESELEKRTFNNLKDALTYLKEEYNVIINFKNDGEELTMVELNIKQIVDELKEYFTGLEEIQVQNNNIILKGDADDFENFMIELYEALPPEYDFENTLVGETYDTCIITIKEKW